KSVNKINNNETQNSFHYNISNITAFHSHPAQIETSSPLLFVCVPLPLSALLPSHARYCCE
ncbi:TPA: hypothetical protein ACQFML_002915, partial [Proteus mirabilis]